MGESIESLKRVGNGNKSLSEQNTPTSPRHNVSFKPLTPVTEESSSLKYSNSQSSADSKKTPPNTSWVTNKLSLLENQPGFSSMKPQLCKTNSNPTTSPCPFNHQTLNRKLSLQNRKSVMTSTFQKGGNLDDLLSDIENLSRDIYNMQLQNSRVLSKSNETIQYHPDVITNSVSMASLRSPNSTPTNSRKPFRSQVNLVLTQPSSTTDKTPISHPPIGFEHFTSFQKDPAKDDIEPPNYPPPPPLTPQEENTNSALLKLSIDTANLRKQFIKTQSQSMNDDLIRQNLTIPPHSKETSRQNNSSEKRPPSLETINESQQPPTAADTCNTTSNGTDEPESPTKSEKSRRKSSSSAVPNFFFRRRKPTKKDNSDDFFGADYMPAASLMKQTTFRGTKNTKVARKNPAKDINQSAATRYQKRMGLLDSMGNKKFGRLSVDSNGVEVGEDSAASLLETSSRESSVSFSRQRRMSSSPEGKKSGDKIPWCACWGNGCY